MKELYHNMLAGSFNILSIAPESISEPFAQFYDPSDDDALALDWEQVGQDLWNAFYCITKIHGQPQQKPESPTLVELYAPTYSWSRGNTRAKSIARNERWSHSVA